MGSSPYFKKKPRKHTPHTEILTGVKWGGWWGELEILLEEDELAIDAPSQL